MNYCNFYGDESYLSNANLFIAAIGRDKVGHYNF